MSEMKELALGYAAAGIPVFPVRSAPEDVVDHVTGEIVTKPDKTPIPSNGLKSATTKTHIINRWWDDKPACAVGVPTGKLAGFWVLDIDVPGDDHVEDGRIWLDDMEALHGRLPVTKWAFTANGGIHFFFKHVDGVANRGAMAAGVDTRGDGGYIVAPGSIMSGGRSYAWGDDTDDIADAPQWLLDVVISAIPPEGDDEEEHERPAPLRKQASSSSSSAGGKNRKYAEDALDFECNELASTGEGGRGHQLNKSAFKLGSLVSAGELSRSEVENSLYQAAAANGSLKKDGERETWAKIRRGLETGERKPRQNIPEPVVRQDNTTLRSFEKMLARAEAKAKLKEGEAYVEPEADEAEEENPIKATCFEWEDPTKIPRRSFLYGKHYIRKYVSVTGSPGGIGKTSNSIVEALAMITSRKLAGVQPIKKKLNVWIYNLEDPRDELTRRVAAACLFYDIKPSDIAGRLFLNTGREQELIIAIEDRRNGVVIQEGNVEAVIEQIKRNKIDVMIVDPFVSTHRVNENDNGAMDQVVKIWNYIADRTECAIDIVHHLKKLADREATVDDMRGASSLVSAARAVRLFNLISAEQAKRAGLDETDRFSVFSITDAKANLAKRDNAQTWRKIEGQGLGNGRVHNPDALKQASGDPEDSAPVITEWLWPKADAGAIVKEIGVENYNRIRTRCDNEEWRDGAKSAAWVGNLIAEVCDLANETKEDKAEIGRIKSDLIKAGALKKETVKVKGSPIVMIRKGNK